MSRQNIKLFAVSFLMLFMEIFLIRWISTEVRIFAYVSNLVLLACFLGIGVGCYFAKKEMNIFITLGMLVLIAISVKSFPFYRITDMLSGFSDSAIWFEFTQGSTIMAAQGVVLTIYMFLMILVAFVPLGQLLGNLLDSHKNIILAYSINIAGSLIGIWAFNMFSLFYTKPWLWFLFSLALLVCFMPWSKQNFSLAAVGSVLILIVTSLSNPNILTVWSPYQKLEVFPTTKKGVPNGNLITVNNVSYMSVTDLSRDFIKRYPNLYESDSLNFNQYEIPYKCSDAKKNVLIVGAGGGNDVAGALRNHAQSIDAVEIDPGIYWLGSRLHPEKPYQDPRVRVIIDDARAFFKKSNRKYDVIVFGLLDSHTLSSNYNNMRLDHYVYTGESFAEARKLLTDDGILAVSFAVERPWIGARLLGVLQNVFGEVPLVFSTGLPTDTHAWGGIMYITGNNPAQLKQHVASQPDLNSYIQKHTISYTGTVRLTTDDWPYLYIERAAIPQMYLVIIIALVILFIAANRFLMSTGEGTVNLHFFFLGSAFMLLEFQNVSKSALLFGSTWIVNSYIISAILALILLANVCAYYFPIKNVLPVYAILLASVLITYFIPLDIFNSLGYPAKSILVSLILNIPIFFASLIFITSFSNAPLKNTALGSNLMGSALGGLLEPFSFVIGIKALLIIVFLLYLLSYVTLAKPKRAFA